MKKALILGAVIFIAGGISGITDYFLGIKPPVDIAEFIATGVILFGGIAIGIIFSRFYIP
jgi:hypothetical protein